MTPEDGDYLRYAAASIELVSQWTAAGPEEFFTDRKTNAAVLYLLQTLTDAMGELSHERRARYPEVPFREMRGFRNVLVHGYIGIRNEDVWEVITRHLPLLQPHVARMLADLDRPHS